MRSRSAPSTRVRARAASRRAPPGPPATTSARAGRPGVRSAMPVVYIVGCCPVARKNAVSSTPIAVGASSRAGSSMIGSPRVVTIRMIVAQPTPSADATRDTAPSWAPTWSNAHARARSVRHARGSIAGCCSVQVFLEHNACGQHQTRLCQHTTTGLPPIGRSRTHTGRRSFARPTAPQSGHGTTRAIVSTSSSSSPPASAAAAEPVQPEQRSNNRTGNLCFHLGLLDNP